MITTSGSGRSVTEVTHGGFLWRVEENILCIMSDDPHSHGSRRTVKVFEVWYSSRGGRGSIGRKVRRKEASPLRFWIVRDMVVVLPRLDIKFKVVFFRRLRKLRRPN